MNFKCFIAAIGGNLAHVFLARVLNVGYIGNVGVYARSHCAVGSFEGNGNNVSY